MKRNRNFALNTVKASFAALLLLAFGMASCTSDPLNEETWTPSVHNAQVESPKSDDITVVANAGGSTQTVSWPVVNGAGGYQVVLTDVGADEVIADSLVDGCSVVFPREEDVNYKVSVLAKGNAKYNNTDAAAATVKEFSTFTPTFKTIPAGDLNEWFAANPIPSEMKGENLNFDLIGGEKYTVSGALDFDGFTVTLRSTSKTNHAQVEYTTEKSEITFTAAFNAKYLDFDCHGMSGSKGVFGFSTNPTVEQDAATGFYLIKEPITIANCNFDNVNGYFLWDNKVKTAAYTVLINNVLCHLTPSRSVESVIWTNKGGHINDFTCQNSTFYNLDEANDCKYFYQAGGYRCTNLNLATNSVNYHNSTFYRIGWNGGQWGNYNGMQGKNESFWVMTDCIFFGCSESGGVPRRFLHGQSGRQNTYTFSNNTYMALDGTFQPVGNYDISGTQIEEDPQFANPAAGDFHISGATQLARRTGDPRWLP